MNVKVTSGGTERGALPIRDCRDGLVEKDLGVCDCREAQAGTRNDGIVNCVDSEVMGLEAALRRQWRVEAIVKRRSQ